MSTDDWQEVTVKLRYRPSALTPGGKERGQPSNANELVAEIDRAMNSATFGGLIELSIEDTGRRKCSPARSIKRGPPARPIMRGPLGEMGDIHA